MTFAAPPDQYEPPEPSRRRFGCGAILGFSALGCLAIILIPIILAGIFFPNVIQTFKGMFAATGVLSKALGVPAHITNWSVNDPGSHYRLANIRVDNPPGFGAGPMLTLAAATGSNVRVGRPAIALLHARLSDLRLTIAQRGADNNLAWEMRFLRPKAPAKSPATHALFQMQTLTVKGMIVLIPQATGGAMLRLVLPAYTLHFNAHRPHSLRYFLRIFFTHTAASLVKNNAVPARLRRELQH